MKLTEEERYMKEAIRQARKAGKLNEVPIGCVIVRDGKIIARGYNRRNTDLNTLAHAELQAIRKASRVVGDWRLEDCVMYITLEPCQMCAGAIVQARIPKVVIGSRNPKAGCAGSVLDLLHVPAFNHQVELEEGVFVMKVLKRARVCGFWHPVIYVPDNLSPQVQAEVIARKKKAIASGAHRIFVFGCIVTCLYWFHPILWFSLYYMKHDMNRL